MATFLTSDLHFGHARIAELCGRPFPHGPAGVDHMNEAIVHAWCEQVTDADTVWVLGDVAMGVIDKTLPILGRLPGTKHLISGNHDRCWPRYGNYTAPKVQRWTAEYRRWFDTIATSGVVASEALCAVTPNREAVLMHHFPYAGDSHFEDRYRDERPVDDGAWLLHGHVHEAWRQRGRQINVGIDAWGGRLVSLDEIIELIAAGPSDLAALPWEATH